MRRAWRETGLTKTCPRCGRLGVVVLAENRPEIHWEACVDRDTDVDTCLRLEDLFRPTFGCGYDSPGQHRRRPS